MISRATIVCLLADGNSDEVKRQSYEGMGYRAFQAAKTAWNI